MSFHPLTISAKTFNQTGNGRYTLSTLAIADPLDQTVISAGSSSKDGSKSAGISRIIYKNVTDANGKVSLKMLRVSVSIQVPIAGFTSAEVSTAIGEINTFSTAANLTRVLLGEN